MRILVVDDEKTLVKGMKFNLENEGYEVECAYDGAAALELAREGRSSVPYPLRRGLGGAPRQIPGCALPGSPIRFRSTRTGSREG